MSDSGMSVSRQMTVHQGPANLIKTKGYSTTMAISTLSKLKGKSFLRRGDDDVSMLACRETHRWYVARGTRKWDTLEGGMVKPEIAKTTEPKQSTHARGVYELCGGLGEPTLHHIYENFPRKYPNFLNWA